VRHPRVVSREPLYILCLCGGGGAAVKVDLEHRDRAPRAQNGSLSKLDQRRNARGSCKSSGGSSLAAAAYTHWRKKKQANYGARNN